MEWIDERIFCCRFVGYEKSFIFNDMYLVFKDNFIECDI